jgi:CheY-like chemotaxis protein
MEIDPHDHGHAQGAANIRQLRHDLLNPLNVLFGMTRVLLDMDLNDTQRTCVQACRNSAKRLLDIAHELERYLSAAAAHDPAGPAQLADLCSIAAARVDKPFDRETLLAVVRELAPAAAPRILLVDDAPEIAVLVQTFLRETGCTIDVVADGEQAIAQASSQPYDLVLMDIDLPGLDGATAAHVIRAADLARGVHPAPVVAMSAVASAVAKRSDDELAPVLDDPDIAPLMPSFLENRRRDAQSMRALLERAAFADIQSIGHNMKGTGRSYGVDAISRIGAEIEQRAHRQDATSVATALDRLDELLGRIKVPS